MQDEAGSRNIADLIERVYEAAKILCAVDTTGPTRIDIEGKRFWVVTTDQKDKIDLTEFRNSLLSEVSWSEAPNIVQLVGDSGTKFRADVLDSTCDIIERDCGSATAIEYGFTHQRHDANWLVHSLLQRRPDASSRIIANVVGQSIDALKSSQWQGSDKVSQFVLLINKHGIRTKFGEDTWLSDNILSAEAGDRIICFEGGVQAFEQCCNALTRGVQVFAVTDLREDSEASRFSAAKLLLQVKALMRISHLATEVTVYLTSCPYLKPEQRTAVVKNALRLDDCDQDFRELILQP